MSRIRESNKQIGTRKGAWTHEEDLLLKKCIEKYGEGKWRQVPLRAGHDDMKCLYMLPTHKSQAIITLHNTWKLLYICKKGLRRCRKSCRLRWLNYLKPGIKRGDFADDEVDLIMRLHRLLGNKWSLIAKRIPGRTANDIKNYWNAHIKKKVASKVEMETKTTIMTTKTSKDKLPSPSTCTLIRPQPRKLTAFNRFLPVTTTLPTDAMSNGIEQDDMTRMKSLSSICEFDDGYQRLTSTSREDDSFERFWEKEMGGLGLEDMFKYCDDLEL